MRSRASLILITLTVAVSGCTHTHRINPTAQPSALNEMNTILRTQKARITLTDGRAFTGIGPQIAPDSTSWFDPDTNDEHIVSTSQVERIVTMKHGRGALDGLKYGALIGACAGLTYGIMSGANEDAGGYGPDWDTGSLTIMGAVDGAIVGLVIGAIVGSRDTYVPTAQIDSSSDDEVKHQE